MTPQERFEIEQDLVINKTKEDLIELVIELLEMVDHSLEQTKFFREKLEESK